MLLTGRRRCVGLTWVTSGIYVTVACGVGLMSFGMFVEAAGTSLEWPCVKIRTWVDKSGCCSVSQPSVFHEKALPCKGFCNRQGEHAFDADVSPAVKVILAHMLHTSGGDRGAIITALQEGPGSKSGARVPWAGNTSTDHTHSVSVRPCLPASASLYHHRLALMMPCRMANIRTCNKLRHRRRASLPSHNDRGMIEEP